MKKAFLALVFLTALGVVGCQTTKTSATTRVSYRPILEDVEISVEVASTNY